MKALVISSLGVNPKFLSKRQTTKKAWKQITATKARYKINQTFSLRTNPAGS